jgi:hypothetical protein
MNSSTVIEPNQVSGDPAELRYMLIMPVWGDHHIDLFLRYCIPFLLTDGNVGAFPGSQLQVHVVSRRADFARMRQDHNYQRLRNLTGLIETEIDSVIDVEKPYRAMTQCYLHVLRRLPFPEETVTFLLTPDCVLSRDALHAMKRQIEAGWRAVMLCGVRLELETIRPMLDRIVASPSGANTITERELSALALRHLHPISLSCDAASNKFLVGWPSHVYWIAPDRTWLLAHCLHLHPMAVRGVPKRIDVNTTIDGDYLLGLGIAADQCYVCESSDELLCLELSPKAKRINTRVGRLTARHLSRFAAVISNAMHRDFFARAILIRGPQEPVIPAQVAHQVVGFINTIKQGPPLIYKWQGFVFSTIRGNPFLRALAGSLLRMGRWLLRHARSEPARRS